MSISDEATIYVDYYNWLLDHEQIPKYYREYLGHVLNHKEMVYLAWLYIGDSLCELGFIDKSNMEDIDRLITNHDDSKFKKDEFIPYAKKFNGPKQGNQKVKTNFKTAVNLHKERNLHHYETLKSYDGDDWKNYVVELICDYIAMGWEFNNYVCEYFERVKDELKNNLPIEYYNFIESIINIIPERLSFAEEPLTENNIGYIYHTYDYYNDPFEEHDIGNKVY